MQLSPRLVFPHPSWIASLSLQTVVSFPSQLVHFLDLFSSLCNSSARAQRRGARLIVFNASLASLFTSGIRAVLWSVGLDLYLNFLFLKHTWTFIFQWSMLFLPAWIWNVPCVCPSRCSEQAWCLILQVGVCVVSHSVGEMDSVSRTEWPAQRLLICEWSGLLTNSWVLLLLEALAVIARRVCIRHLWIF